MVLRVHYTFVKCEKWWYIKRKAEEDQKQFKLDLIEITRENPRKKSEGQLNAIENIKTLYESRKKVVELYNDNAKIISKANSSTSASKVTNSSCTSKSR